MNSPAANATATNAPIALKLLNDAPLTAPERAERDAGRLTPLINALVGRMRASPKPGGWRRLTWWTRSHIEPQRIGLFGGLGEGKSTVLAEVLRRHEAAHPRPRWMQLLLGPRVVRFDVSQFKADDLEWRFLTAVLWRRAWAVVFVVLLALLGVLFILSAAGLVSAFWDPMGWLHTLTHEPAKALLWLVGTAGVVLATLPALPELFGRLGHTGKDVAQRWLAADLFVGQRDWWSHQLARYTGTLPEWVVVDDLDRAQVTQQRAFLRALARFSARMGFSVLVSLDESELLDSAPDPEAPAELLRKTIHFELRVPDRGPEDLALLAITTLSATAELNRPAHPELSAALLDPLLVADFTRVLCLLPAPVSPRLVKRLLADALLAGEQRRASDSAASGARQKPYWQEALGPLLRLQALLLLAPELRKHSRALCEALECNRRHAFESLRPWVARSRATGELPAWLNLLCRTRMMQPRHGEGWFHLINGMALPLRLEDHGPPDPWDRDQVWRLRADSVSGAPAEAAPKLVEIYRLFGQSIRHAADGHVVSARFMDFPSASGPAQDASPTLRLLPFHVEAADGRLFRGGEYPATWCVTAHGGSRTAAWLPAHFWPHCVAALSLAPAAERSRLLHRPHPWLTEARDDEGVRRWLERAWQRELLADEDLWAELPATVRRRELDKLVGHGAERTPEWLTLVALQPEDLAPALGALSEARDDARALTRWLGGTGATAHLPAEGRLADREAGESVPKPLPAAAAEFWPPVRPAQRSAEGWCQALGEHLRLWAHHPGLRDRAPDALDAAWRHTWPLVNASQRLELLDRLLTEDTTNGDEVWRALHCWQKLTPRPEIRGSPRSGLDTHAFKARTSTQRRLSGRLWQWMHQDSHWTADMWANEWRADERALFLEWLPGLMASDDDDGFRVQAVRADRCDGGFWAALLTTARTMHAVGSADESSMQAHLRSHPDYPKIADDLGWADPGSTDRYETR